MQNNLFQQAKDAVNNLFNGNASEADKQAAQNAIQSAYDDASPQEKEHLQQLEQQLKQSNQLK
ncbi:DUF3813 family protein [Oceanobacillus sp. Castelsardo]|uniref:DUF3813 family protein n=1 Tax=Oceanobacillus sp. Castelsardo TaxID=1851204 RepID=UPI0008388F17|nr:DUF3813 family protein [Oceanobacillus sp. Castelsardo]